LIFDAGGDDLFDLGLAEIQCNLTTMGFSVLFSSRTACNRIESDSLSCSDLKPGVFGGTHV
jgi:hypothetical protein